MIRSETFTSLPLPHRLQLPSEGQLCISHINSMQRNHGLSLELLFSYRCAFSKIRMVIIDEISMIGAGVFHTINERLKTITYDHDKPVGGMGIVFCGDLRQLPPVLTAPIYEPVRKRLHRSTLWQSLTYYPLQKVRGSARFERIISFFHAKPPSNGNKTHGVFCCSQGTYLSL